MLTFVHDIGQVTFSITIFLTIYYKRGLRPIGIFPQTSVLGFGTRTKEKEKEKKKEKDYVHNCVFDFVFEFWHMLWLHTPI